MQFLITDILDNQYEFTYMDCADDILVTIIKYFDLKGKYLLNPKYQLSYRVCIVYKNTTLNMGLFKSLRKANQLRRKLQKEINKVVNHNSKNE